MASSIAIARSRGICRRTGRALPLVVTCGGPVPQTRVETAIRTSRISTKRQRCGHISRQPDFLQGSYPGTAADVTGYITSATPTQAPTNPWNGVLLLARTDEYLNETGTPPARLHLILGRNIPVEVMRELDVKIDDSQPGTGVLRAPGTATTFGTVGQESTPSCVTAGTPDIWNITGSSVDCNGYYLF